MKRVINKRQDLEKLYNEYVGNGKVQSVSFSCFDGEYTWRFKEKGVFKTISSKNREELEKMHIEFGGKNPETCRAPDNFLEFDGTWTGKDLIESGHRITKIKIFGYRYTRNNKFTIQVPKHCGCKEMMRTKKSKSDEITFIQQDFEKAEVTMSFDSSDEFDNFIKFIQKNQQLKGLKWLVSKIGTESKDDNNQCVWKRKKAGDGTQRMVLLLQSLNGKDYTECMRSDLFNAAGDLFYAPCERLKAKKQHDSFQEICRFAVEDGMVSVPGTNNEVPR